MGDLALRGRQKSPEFLAQFNGADVEGTGKAPNAFIGR